MRKILFVLLLPVFFVTERVISTEKDVRLTEEERYQVTSTSYGNYYQTLPRNPNLYKTEFLYADGNLKKIARKLDPDTPFKITELHVNDQGLPIFKLSNGLFIPADKRIIFEDIVLTKEAIKESMWVKPSARCYLDLPVNGVKAEKQELLAYTKVIVVEKATTPKGTFMKLNDNRWTSAESLSPIDNRMEKVQDILSSRYQKEDYSIFVKQLSTGKIAGIHPDKQMYAASIAKLPVLYYTQKMLDEKKISLADSLKYLPEVNDYAGAYDPEGSGSLSKEADNKDYTVQELIYRISKESDNVAHNILGYYVTHQSDKAYQETLTKIAGQKWDVENRQASSKMAGQVMEAIYLQNGGIIDSLSQTNYDDERISKDIPVKVAHKIGDAYDFKHDVAIVYADSPFILSIFTNNSNYDTISQIANDVYGVLK